MTINYNFLNFLLESDENLPAIPDYQGEDSRTRARKPSKRIKPYKVDSTPIDVRAKVVKNKESTSKNIPPQDPKVINRTPDTSWKRGLKLNLKHGPRKVIERIGGRGNRKARVKMIDPNTGKEIISKKRYVADYVIAKTNRMRSSELRKQKGPGAGIERIMDKAFRKEPISKKEAYRRGKERLAIGGTAAAVGVGAASAAKIARKYNNYQEAFRRCKSLKGDKKLECKKTVALNGSKIMRKKLQDCNTIQNDSVKKSCIRIFSEKLKIYNKFLKKYRLN